MSIDTAVPPPPHADATIADLLAVPADRRDEAWLHGALQAAVELELSTIPPYLCALWSIKDQEAPSSAVAALRLHHVAVDEMYHLGVVCNLLVALGRRPLLRARAPVYPGPLPRGIVPGLVVQLQGLTRGLVGDVFMGIEQPEDPLARSYDTVGAFYDALIQRFGSHPGPLSPRNQRELAFGGHELSVVRTREQAVQALTEIKEEGEGTATDPLFGDELAHYYRFGELAHGRRLVRTGPNGEWAWAGERVPFPAWRTEVYPMAQVPHGGWPRPLPGPVEAALQEFDRIYTEMLDGLERAWNGDEPALLAAIESMHHLPEPAQALMRSPCGGGEFTYGPDFRPLR